MQQVKCLHIYLFIGLPSNPMYYKLPSRLKSDILTYSTFQKVRLRLDKQMCLIDQFLIVI